MNDGEKKTMCVECGERPFNPKYSKIMKCSKCVAKTRKPRGSRKPLHPGHGDDVLPPVVIPQVKPSRTNGRPVTLTTINSVDLEGDTIATMRIAQEWVDKLNAAGIPTMLEIAIRIIPEEGRVQ
ncbi:MAG: hypothetical protein P1S46_06255 [bacterium]|nr:hypothetical protein [bacterium]